MRLLILLLAVRTVLFGAGFGGVVSPPDGWPVWAKAPDQEVYLAPDPEIEEALLRVYRAPSVSLRGTLSGELREAVRGRNVVRISPEHHGTTEDGLAVMAQVVISDDAEGARRHTLLAVVQGVRVAVLLHFETSSEERLSQHFQLLMNTASAVRFPGS
jgi:hypothetical protein